MSLDNCNVVDAVGIDKADGAVVLSVIDSWSCDDEGRHLAALQENLNAYFFPCRVWQIYDSYPDAVGKTLRIDVIGRYPAPPVGLAFLEKASAVAAKLQVAVTHRLV